MSSMLASKTRVVALFFAALAGAGVNAGVVSSAIGVTASDNGGSNFSAFTGVSVLQSGNVPIVTGQKLLGNGLNLLFQHEDQSDTAGTGVFLGPNHGGQDYDAEFLGVSRDPSNDLISIVLITGQRPDNGLSNYSPGDLRISTSQGLFGIEMGGASASSAETFTVNGSGFTSAVTSHATRAAGSIWHANGASDWLLDPLAPQEKVQLNHAAIAAAKQVGTTSLFSSSKNTATTQHSVFEIQFDAFAAFGGSVFIGEIFWAPSCGNDELRVSLNQYTNPEPATLAIWAGGIACGAFGWRRKRA